MKLVQTMRIKVWLLAIAILLSGCMYPGNQGVVSESGANPMYVEMVQKAIDQYQKDTGVLPLVTTKMNTPIFEKYEIDFTKLRPRYIPDIPADAFEKGGVYKYVLIDAETKPTVRLIDLRLVEKVTQIQQAVSYFQYTNNGKLPLDQKVGNGYYTIRFELVGQKRTEVQSPFTNHPLPLVMNERGEVGIDYTSDLEALLESSGEKWVKDTDPRYLLARESWYVPIKSFPYEVVEGKPQMIPY